jgi:hypothetical protein
VKPRAEEKEDRPVAIASECFLPTTTLTLLQLR